MLCSHPLILPWSSSADASLTHKDLPTFLRFSTFWGCRELEVVIIGPCPKSEELMIHRQLLTYKEQKLMDKCPRSSLFGEMMWDAFYSPQRVSRRIDPSYL